MNITETIINNVVRGMVLDIKGNWVPIAQMKMIEHNVLKHLEAGEVLHDGQWISMRKFKTISSQTFQATDPTHHSHEADHISNKRPIPWVVVSCNSGEQYQAPDTMLPLIRQVMKDNDGD